MPADPITKSVAYQSSAVQFLARILNNDGDNIQQADITGITCKVFDIKSNTPTTATATPTITVASVVFDAIQNDSRWNVDNTGYNFLHPMPATVFSTAKTLYRVEYLFDPVTGEDFFVCFEVSTVRTFTNG